jgi:hypothetical protein
MNLPRAAKASQEAKSMVWREFSENMAEHLIWESARALRFGNLGQPVRSLSIIPQLDPLTLMRIAKHRVLGLRRAALPESLASPGLT